MRFKEKYIYIYILIYFYIYVYIYIFLFMITGDFEDIKQQRCMHIVATSYGPNLMGSRPGAPRGYVYTGPGGSLRWPSSHRPPMADGEPTGFPHAKAERQFPRLIS